MPNLPAAVPNPVTPIWYHVSSGQDCHLVAVLAHWPSDIKKGNSPWKRHLFWIYISCAAHHASANTSSLNSLNAYSPSIYPSTLLLTKELIYSRHKNVLVLSYISSPEATNLIKQKISPLKIQLEQHLGDNSLQEWGTVLKHVASSP